MCIPSNNRSYESQTCRKYEQLKRENLWPPNVGQVVVGFNYEVHNKSAYIFNTSATSFGLDDPDDPDVLSATDILAICGHLVCDLYL